MNNRFAIDEDFIREPSLYVPNVNPSHGVQINRRMADVYGLEFAIYPKATLNGRDLVQGLVPELETNIEYAPHGIGRGAVFDPGGTSRLAYASQPFFNAARCTIVCKLFYSSTGLAPVCTKQISGSSYRYQRLTALSGTAYWQQSQNGTSWQTNVSSGPIAIRKHTIAASNDENEAKLFFDRELLGTDSTPATGQGPDTDDELFHIGYDIAAGHRDTGIMDAFLFFSVGLPETEVKRIMANPYMFLEPQRC